MYVEKRGEKYRFVERYTIAGVSRRISVTMDRNTPQARKKAQQLLLQKSANFRSDVTYSELVAAYIDHQKKVLKPATWVRNQHSLQRLQTFLGDCKVDKLTAGAIRATLEKHYTNPATLNEYIKRLRALLKWGYTNDMISSRDVFDKLTYYKDTPSREKIKDKYLETSELQAVLEHATPYYRNLFEFLALSGLRIGEASALLDSDVTDKISVTKSFDYNNKIVTSPKTYTSNRAVHIQPELAECVARVRELSDQNRTISRKPCDLFFVSPYGDRISYHKANETFKRLCRQYAPRERTLTIHALRHTHVSLMAEHGIPLPAISRRLGHSSSRITKEIYFHVTKKAEASEALLFDSVTILPPICPRSK